MEISPAAKGRLVNADIPYEYVDLLKEAVTVMGTADAGVDLRVMMDDLLEAAVKRFPPLPRGWVLKTHRKAGGIGAKTRAYYNKDNQLYYDEEMTHWYGNITWQDIADGNIKRLYEDSPEQSESREIETLKVIHPLKAMSIGRMYISGLERGLGAREAMRVALSNNGIKMPES